MCKALSRRNWVFQATVNTLEPKSSAVGGGSHLGFADEFYHACGWRSLRSVSKYDYKIESLRETTQSGGRLHPDCPFVILFRLNVPLFQKYTAPFEHGACLGPPRTPRGADFPVELRRA